MEVLFIFSKQIKAVRRWFRYSLEDFGELAGVTRQTVAKWESGDCIPDVLTVEKLAKRLDMTVDEFLHFYENLNHVQPGPKERYIFDTIKVGHGGKITLSKKVREELDIKPGDEMFVLGDRERGVELLPANIGWEILKKGKVFIDNSNSYCYYEDKIIKPIGGH